MDNKKAISLLTKYDNGTCTPEEKKLVEAWYLEVSSKIEDKQGIPDYQQIDSNIRKGLHLSEVEKQPVKLWWSIAAAILVAVFAAALYNTYNRQDIVKPMAAKSKTNQMNDRSPGGNFATITLADGRIVSLDQVATGQIAADEFVKITKTHDGQIVYEVLNRPGEELAYNTITTPHGGQYQVVLPDGTKVWLNAESSLRYPVVFAKRAREVTLTGEAFFEVKKNPNGISTPFLVKTIRQSVEVLGTHFNINAYENEEEVVTSLLEGRVRVRPDKEAISAVELKPSTQGVLGRKGLKVRPFDAEATVAWKNGLFYFQHTDLKTILRQLSRWYAIDVDYASLPDLHFNGSIPRNVNLSKVLNMFELTGNIRFKIEDNKLYIDYPKPRQP